MKDNFEGQKNFKVKKTPNISTTNHSSSSSGWSN